MADDLDQLIRAAMKTLDEQVPSGYFEALPNQTLARLEGSMQHGSSGTTDTRDARNVPPMSAGANDPDTSPVARQPQAGEERDEDSGLHDIRNLAQSTKQRLSGRKITAQPFEDDVLSASSGSFKNIALPQPAKMVSLPSIEELPSKAEVVAAEKAAKKAAKEKKAEPVAVAAVAPVLEAKVETPVAPSASTRAAFTLPSQQRKGGKGPLLALVGVGVAAAAGYVIFLQVNKTKADQAASSAAPAGAAEQAKADMGAGSAAAVVTAQPIETTPPAAAAEPAPPVEAPKDEAAAGAAQLAADDVKAAEEKASDKKKPAKGSKGSSKTKLEKEEPAPKKEETPKPPEKTKPVATKGGGEAEGEPSFDALLKEAGVSDQKKEAKPKLDKKSLTGDDFKKGMNAVEGKAKDCYKGTQGTALVKLTVSPSGSISKISVAGDFAGKPEASCVQSAIKAATFPPWDGGPQSFTYAVLLSD